jgi:hypothetical protein
MHFDAGMPDGGVPAFDAGTVTFSSTVPRELVHRWGLSEVFMTDIRRVGQGRYIAGAQWPRLHTFYHPIPRVYDSALIVESLRQATILAAHSMEGVPLGQFFLYRKWPFTPSTDTRVTPVLRQTFMSALR